jgi:predicted nucleic acid-binding protein
LDKAYVLDTSALFAYIELEAGSEAVEHILALAEKSKCTVFVSFISFLEAYYVTWQRKGEDSAKRLMMLLKSLPVERVESCERLILSAGNIKANHRLSLADAIIAATAIEKEAILVHKDPEFKAVSGDLKTLFLPGKV